VAHSAILSWSAPLYNKNGSELMDLVGYRIYYGQTATQLDMTKLVSGPKLTSYKIANRSSGTSYFFSITALNKAGYESPKSDAVKLIL
jgi:fibronectin type 3 domain-containing protein